MNAVTIKCMLSIFMIEDFGIFQCYEIIQNLNVNSGLMNKKKC